MKNRNGALDLLKFLFAVEVVCYHGFSDDKHFVSGYLATDFFFIVTGMLFARAVSAYQVPDAEIGADTLRFMKRKICSLLPNYYIAWFIAFAVMQLCAHSTLRQSFENLSRSYGELLFVSSSGMKDYFANGPMWYISAMLFALLLLYPLAKKFRDNFFYLIAPIIFLFLMGFSFQNYLALYQDERFGICSGRIIRAVMVICLGCICYKIAEWLARYQLTMQARLFLTLVEVSAYLAVFRFMDIGDKADKRAWLMLYVMAVGAVLSYAGTGIHSKYCNNKLSYWLGAYSYNCYLGHMAMLQIVYSYTRLPLWQKNILYLVLTAWNALFIMYVSKGLRYLWKKWKDKAVDICVKNA